MQTHYELSDQDFELQFSNATLNETLFTHEAHLRLAWIHIKKYGIEAAVENVKVQLKQYVTSLGAIDKYNETVTIAAVKAVNHFIAKTKTINFSDFILENAELLYNFKGLLLSHYTTNIFESKMARNNFIEPELQSFD